jgi:glycosyltransferase involved in cell wall biosynthesis
MNNLSILTCCYNTPQEVVKLLRSVKQTSEELPKLLLMNTSTNDSELVFQRNEIPYFNYRGGIHGEAVNLGLRKVKTRYVLLVDSDVIFLKDYKKAFERFKECGCALMGKVVGDCAGKSLYPRVEPWYCFIDLDQLKKHKIEFFDRERTLKSKSSDRVYDIGSTMFEDVEKAGLKIGDADMEGKYFRHYGGMSWHCATYDPSKPDTDVDFGGTHPNKALYDHGMRVKHQYDVDTKHLNNMDVGGAFSHE